MSRKVIDLNEEAENGVKAIAEGAQDVVAGAEATFGAAFATGWKAFGSIFTSSVPVPHDTKVMQDRLAELKKRDKEDRKLVRIQMKTEKLMTKTEKLAIKGNEMGKTIQARRAKKS